VRDGKIVVTQVRTIRFNCESHIHPVIHKKECARCLSLFTQQQSKLRHFARRGVFAPKLNRWCPGT